MDNQFRTTPQPQPKPESDTVAPQPLAATLPPIQQPIQSQSIDDLSKSKKSKRLLATFLVILGLIVVAAASLFGWYFLALQPVDTQATEQQFQINPGSTPSDIGQDLEAAGIIRSSLAFMVNSRVQGVQGGLQAGKYSLSPASSTGEVIAQLVEGPDIETFGITFLPGATLSDHREVLIKVGYTSAEVDQAFKRQYDHPLFGSRPQEADLEGYIYGETHYFDKGTSLEAVLGRYFDDFYKVIEENDLVALFGQKNLTLFEGITLASIVQRESIGCPGEKVCQDQREIASVFYNRLAADMPLGSDVTYHYAADKRGVARDYRLDSPYNTRIHSGLTPGPIASPGVSALLAVADPADTDYMYFLSGDDDRTYFATTNDGHEANIRNHCHEKCLLP